LLIDKTSLIYRNVELKATARDFSSHVKAFEQIPPHMNTKTGPQTKDDNSYPLEFQQTVGRTLSYKDTVLMTVVESQTEGWGWGWGCMVRYIDFHSRSCCHIMSSLIFVENSINPLKESLTTLLSLVGISFHVRYVFLQNLLVHDNLEK
jgi:hypothetical protein